MTMPSGKNISTAKISAPDVPVSNSFPIPDRTESETLNRSMSIWSSFTMGFAVVSPVVGLYAIFGLQNVVTGGGWLPALAICLVMQLLVATVYAELSSQFPIAGGAYKWSRQLGGVIAGQYAGVIYISSTIAMLTTTAYTGGIWLATVYGSTDTSGTMMVFWGAVFLLMCMLLNLAHVRIFKIVIAMALYAEIIGSFGIAVVLFLFCQQNDFTDLFQHLGTGTAPGELAAFLAALAIAGWAFIGFDACSTTAEETHEPKRQVPRAIFLALSTVGSVVLFNTTSLSLAFDHDTVMTASATSDPLTPLIASTFGTWIAQYFAAIVLFAFFVCGASVVKYTSRIVFSMAREGNMPIALSNVTANKTPRNAIIFVVVIASLGLILGLNDNAVGTIIAFGTGGLYAMFAMTTGMGLFARITGRWDPALGELNLGVWGLPINIAAFIWSLFELINIAWPRVYIISADAPWYQLWAIPIVLGSILSITTLYILINKNR